MAFTTRMSVIQRLRTGDPIGWEEFHTMYRPLILLRGRDRGLTTTEREDLVQQVLLNLFRSASVFSYDPRKGHFRDFLRKIIDRRAFDLLRRRRPEEKSWEVLEAEGVVKSSEDSEQMEARWDEAWREHLLRQALIDVRPQVTETTYRAFEMCVVDGVKPQRVATELGISVASVYVAKHRVLNRLRDTVKTLETDV